jgi:hypothetical protein
MAIWMAGAVVVAAVVAGAAYVWTSSINADAQRDVAETNARATVQAAKEAADAQKTAALHDANARMHEADVAFNTEMEYLKQDKWAVEHEDALEQDIRTTQAEIDSIDSIDTYYAGEGNWGAGSQDPYDYGYGDGGMTFS